MSRYGKTKNGYEITNVFTDKVDGRKHVVFLRNGQYFDKPNYNVGLGYDFVDGVWNQGVYDFRSRKQAINYAKNHANNKTLLKSMHSAPLNKKIELISADKNIHGMYVYGALVDGRFVHVQSDHKLNKTQQKNLISSKLYREKMGFDR